MQRCCQAIVRRTLSDSDTAEERNRKEIWVPLVSALLPLAIFFHVLVFENYTQAREFGVAIAIVGMGIGLLWPLCTKTLPLHFVGIDATMMALCVVLMDASNAAALASFRPWTLIVLIMDVFLALHVPVGYQRVSLYALCLWLVVSHLENAERLGLYDIEGFTNANGKIADLCQCADPPCGLGLTELFQALPSMATLLGDYFATRGFAEGLRAEQVKVLAAVEVAEQVATSLAGFDLEVATDVLDEAAELPPRLSGGFRRLLGNLASYRPYLPESCFQDAEEGAQAAQSMEDDRQQTCGTAAESSVFERNSTNSSNVTRTVTGGSAGTDASVRSPRRRSSFVDAVLARTAHAPQTRRVTLLARNASGFLSAQLSAGAVGAWLSQQVQRFQVTIKAQGGMTDHLSGDHFTAVFGAVKLQGTQCTSATRAAAVLSRQEGMRASTAPTSPRAAASARFPAALPQTAAVCTGSALCGDFGSATSQRFMVIGGVASFVAAAERAAAAWRVGTLIDSVVHADAQQNWNCRVRKYVHFPKLTPKPIGLWEVLTDRLQDGPADEWMYELDNAKPNAWQGYNEAVTAWCGHDEAKALVAIAKALDDAAQVGEEAAEGLLALQELVRTGAPPPMGELTAAALAGDPAPLRCA
eukprot:TRINITY_DN177_c0_g2_i1.p1 TRINITY_DN177_c0_g2~~TRINITY_DN177_c0_g2_i1.p1  ORF type:complete len:669 (+),score=157.99 TRINITY_DN177_c0_g2_i1:83-2008(+)